MLDDRPLLRASLASRPALRSWLAARFLGAGQGFPVEWDPSPPRSGQPAEHEQPERPGAAGRLRIADRHTGLDQLALAVFELTNMEGGDAFAALWGKAVAHQITRAAFAEGMTRTELAARARFKIIAREQGLVAGPKDVMLKGVLDSPDDYDAFRRYVDEARIQGATYDPLEYWGNAYDTIPR